MKDPDRFSSFPSLADLDGRDGRPKPSIRVSEIISALSYALDLTEGQPMGHSVRACIIGMRLAEQIGLPARERGDLYYALLLKDAGCSSNSSRLFHIVTADEIKAKRDVKLTDWTRVGWESLNYALTHVATGLPFLQRVRLLFQVAAMQQQDSCALVKIRCERGADIAKQLGFSDSVVSGIYSLDEHWNGRGYPDGLRRDEIPLFSRIANLSQTLDVFHTERGPVSAIDAACRRSGRWFDPELVNAAVCMSKDGTLWSGLENPDLLHKVIAAERLLTERTSLRFGYVHANNPVPSSTLTPMTAAIMSNQISTGLVYHPGRSSLEFAYSYDPTGQAQVQQSGLLSGEYNNSTVRVGTQAITMNYSYRF